MLVNIMMQTVQEIMFLIKKLCEADSNLSQIQNEIFALYQLCTLFVSWNAIKAKKIKYRY